MRNIEIREGNLITERDLREQCMERVEILDKVKKLFLIPELEIMTIRQVAEYYDVGFEAIQSCYKDNKNEIDNDGVIIRGYKDFLTVPEGQLETLRGKAIIRFKDMTLEIPNRGIKCFSKRAILRIGMLLRDSEVAKEVRTQLLNTFEHTTNKQKTDDMDTEINFVNDIGKAYMSGDINEFAVVTQKYIAFQNRHIEKIEKDNKILAGEILEWTDRKSLNKAVRILAGKTHQHFATVFSELYNELRYKHSIGLSQRGNKPLIQHIREEEWPNVIQSFSAICEVNDCSPSEILEKAKV